MNPSDDKKKQEKPKVVSADSTPVASREGNGPIDGSPRTTVMGNKNVLPFQADVGQAFAKA